MSGSSESATAALKRLQELRALREDQLRQQQVQEPPPQQQADPTPRTRLVQEHRAHGEMLRAQQMGPGAEGAGRARLPTVGHTAHWAGPDPSMAKAQELLARSAQLRQQAAASAVAAEPELAPPTVPPAAHESQLPRDSDWAETAAAPLPHSEERLAATSSPAESVATAWSAYSDFAFDRASDAGLSDAPPAPAAELPRYQFRGTPTKSAAGPSATVSPRRAPPVGSLDEAHPSTGEIQPPADWSGPVLKQMKKTKQWKVRACRLDAAAGRLQLHDAKKVRTRPFARQPENSGRALALADGRWLLVGCGCRRTQSRGEC